MPRKMAKIVIEPLKNHGKSMGKPWENGDLSSNYGWLVVTGTMEFYDFPFSWEWTVIIPTDEVHHFFRGVGIPPTRM